jgi:hypothetical protein
VALYAMVEVLVPALCGLMCVVLSLATNLVLNQILVYQVLVFLTI